MTEYIRKLLIDNKDLIDQDNFEEVYNRSRIGFRPELTTIFKHCNIDPLLMQGKFLNMLTMNMRRIRLMLIQALSILIVMHFGQLM